MKRVKVVTHIWETDDGKQFKTKKEAAAYEATHRTNVKVVDRVPPGPFDEESWVCTLDNEEAYVDVATVDGKKVVFDVYIYNDNPLVKEQPGKWLLGKNPLFLHAANPAAAVRSLRARSYIKLEDEP